MDRKGSIGISSSQMLWIIRLIWMGIAVVVCLVLISLFIKINYDNQLARKEIFIQRVLYSPNGISYFNELSGRMEAGTIDLRKFDTLILEKSIAYPEDYLAAKIVLENLEKKTNQTIYYHQKTYGVLSPLKGIAGKGRIDSLDRNIFVRIKTDRGFEKGKIYFEVLMYKGET